jgi:hypothetical protein
VNSYPIDWGVVGVWAQVFAIAATGGAAVLVGRGQLVALNKQLSAFNDNERIRTSLKALDDMYKRVQYYDYQVSPYEAVSAVGGMAKHPGRLEAYLASARLQAEGKELTDAQANEHADKYAYAVILANYFVMLGDLVDRNLVDEAFVLEKIGQMICVSYDGMKAMGDLEDTVSRTMFVRLHDKAKVYLEATTPKP